MCIEHALALFENDLDWCQVGLYLVSMPNCDAALGNDLSTICCTLVDEMIFSSVKQSDTQFQKTGTRKSPPQTFA